MESKKDFVSFDVWAEWLSKMTRMVSCAGYFKSSIFKKRIKSELLCVERQIVIGTNSELF